MGHAATCLLVGAWLCLWQRVAGTAGPRFAKCRLKLPAPPISAPAPWPVCHPSLPLQLLACLRVIVATSEELQQVVQKGVDPLAGAISADNEEQALATLQAALQSMLEPLQQLPLQQLPLQQLPLLGPAPGSGAEQLPPLSLEQQSPSGAGGALPCSEEQQQQGCNENGFDADWQMSRHFCRLYLEGQLHILQRSLQECHSLMQL